MRLSRPPDRVTAVELMDRPQPRPVMEVTLRELEGLNRLLGIGRLMLRFLGSFVLGRDRDLTIADVGAGGADLPRLFVRWGAARGLRVGVVALDAHPVTAAIARDWSSTTPAVRVALADARVLPLPDRSVDVATMTTVLHHLDPPEAIRALRELDRVSRRGFIVTDPVRSRAAYAGARLLGATILRPSLPRTDAPLSVLRSYTEEEARAIVDTAGVAGVTVGRHPLFRLSIVKHHAHGRAR